MTCSFQSGFKNRMKAVDPLRMIHTYTHTQICINFMKNSRTRPIDLPATIRIL